MTELMTIDVVEDDAGIREILQMALADLGGFELRLFADGMQALEYWQNHPLPQMLLLDVMLPQITGPELIPRLRQLPQAEQLYIILMTAKADPGDAPLLLSAGAQAIITKPFDPLALPELLQQHWAQHQPDTAQPLPAAQHQALLQLRERFLAGLPERLDAIRQAWQQCQQQPADTASRVRLIEPLHKLVGASGSLGYRLPSQLARALEQYLQRPETPADQLLTHLQAHLPRLLEMCQQLDRDAPVDF